MQLDDVQIEVGNPQQISKVGGINKYLVYPLRGKDSQGQIAVLRRYSDFDFLRETLIRRWPGCYISSLPEKKTIGSSEPIFVESRRRSLQMFLETLAVNQVIWYSQEMQLFLKNNTEEVQNLLSPLLKQSLDNILGRYAKIFRDFYTGQATQEASTSTTQFQEYLKNNKVFLDQLTEKIQKISEVYSFNLQKKLAVLEFLLPEYQKNFLLYDDENAQTDMLFLEAEKYQIKDKIEKFKEANQYLPILFVLEEIKREQRQIQAFEEIIRTKNQIQDLRLKATVKVKKLQLEQSKINAQKYSILTLILGQSKQSQLVQNKKAIDSAKAEETMYTTVYQILTNMIGTKEIYKFKQLRQKSYYKMLKNFAELEKEISSAECDIWLAVQNHDLVGKSEQRQDSKSKQGQPQSQEQKQQSQQMPQEEDQQFSENELLVNKSDDI